MVLPYMEVKSRARLFDINKYGGPGSRWSKKKKTDKKAWGKQREKIEELKKRRWFVNWRECEYPDYIKLYYRHY